MKTFYSLSWTAYCLAVCCYLLVASIIGQSSIVAQTSTSCMGDFMPYATVARSNGEMFRQFADINMDGLTDIITQESGATPTSCVRKALATRLQVHRLL
jgi:hypothetical protein